MATIPDEVRPWFDGKLFATFATVEPSMQPHLSVVWVALDGDDVLVSTVEGRRKHSNLVREPYATLLAMDPDDPYRYLEVRGHVSMTPEGGRELIDALARRYRGTDRYLWDRPDAVRVVVRLHADKVVFKAR